MYFVLQINGVQNFIAEKVKNKLEPFLGVQINFDRISIDLQSHLVVKNLVVLDIHKDTLVSSKSVKFGLESISFSSRKVKIKKIELDQARIYFFIDSARMLNLEYVVDRVLSSSDSTTPGWLVEFDNIGIVDSRLRIEDVLKNPYSGKGVNFSDFVFNNLNIRVKDLTVWDGLATLKINRLSFLERSGFDLEKLSGRMSIRKKMMHFDNLAIVTPNSLIEAPRVYFQFNRFGEFSDFAQKIDFQFWFRDSKVSLKDLAYFSNDLQGMTQEFSFQARAKGKLSSLNCTDFIFNTGNSTSFKGKIAIDGLPDFKNVNMDINVGRLTVLPADIENIYFPSLESKHLMLPEILKNFGKIQFSGTFKGKPDNFTTSGIFETEAGTIKTDLALKPESKQKISIQGTAIAHQLDFGKILRKEPLLGAADADIKADFVIENGTKVSGTFNTLINQCLFNNYIYNNISISGDLKENAFDGIVKIDDPNVKFSSAGYFNFSKANRTFNFSSTIYQANPLALNFTKDSISYLSGQFIANFAGHSIDSIEGEVGLSNVFLKKNQHSLFIKNIYARSNSNTSPQKIDIRSDMFVASIRGTHELSILPASIIKFARYYLPETLKDYAIPLDYDDNDLTFDIQFKDTKSVLDFFVPGSVIATNSSIKGKYFPAKQILQFDLQSDSLQFDHVRFLKLAAHFDSNADSMKLWTASSQMFIGDQINLQNTNAFIRAESDSIFINSTWQDSVGNNSKLSFLSRIVKRENQKPLLAFDILPSEIYILKDRWLIDKAYIAKDSTSLSIPGLKMANKQHLVNISGIISESVEDVLTAEFSDFNLNLVNYLLNSSKINLKGVLSGKVLISDFYKTRQVIANVNIEDFSVNQEIFGSTNIGMQINNLTRQLAIQANSYFNNKHKLQIEGFYMPSADQLNFNFALEETGAHVFMPFVESIFGIRKGNINGEGSLTGTLSRPVLNANLTIDSASILIKPLNTNYSFNAPVKIIDNKFVLKNIKLHDGENNICKLDGYIDNYYFENFQLYINLLMDKNLVLDLRPEDEMPFYGKGFASGIVRITGNTDQVNIDIINAKTEKNTVIYIPLNQESIVTNDFITFSSQQKVSGKQPKPKPVYQVKASGLVLNIDLEVSPDAEVQLVFDPALGDIMRAQGSGNLKMELNKSGNFTIRGNYEVKSGDYLFTLKNLLNKQFIIDQGGSIQFNGSPLDATLDITALYKTRTSLYNLFYEDEYKKRIPVNCQLLVSGKLLNPEIRYDVLLPSAADETKNKVKEVIKNEQDLSKQFISVLVLNNFLPDPGRAAATGSTQANASILGRDAAASTSLELLSSQVSNWMSQISKDFDVGVNYRPGDKSFTNQEFEVAMSTQLLDDRVSINGNLDFIGNQSAASMATKQNSSNLVGDVNVEVKITDKVLVKAFNRSNDQLYDYNDLYTRGVGVAYREEFRNLKELRQRYYQLLFSPKLKPDTIKMKN